MRIIVFSDSHGSYAALKHIVSNNLSADIFIHLGDGERELDRIVTEYPDKNFHHVKGNCDYASFSDSVLMLFLGGNHKLFATHGHTMGVKYSTDKIVETARANGADIVLFGHTHASCRSYCDGLYILNPGSCSCPRDGKPPSYGFIDVTDSGIFTAIVTL